MKQRTTCHNNIATPKKWKKVFSWWCRWYVPCILTSFEFFLLGIAISPYDLLGVPLFGLGTAPYPSSSPWYYPGACHFSVTILVGQPVLSLGLTPKVKWINLIVCCWTLHFCLVDTKYNHPPEIYNSSLHCGCHQRNRTSAQAARRSVAGTGAWHIAGKCGTQSIIFVSICFPTIWVPRLGVSSVSST